jgi:hypothetical protein
VKIRCEKKTATLAKNRCEITGSCVSYSCRLTGADRYLLLPNPHDSLLNNLLVFQCHIIEDTEGLVTERTRKYQQFQLHFHEIAGR